MTTLQQAVKEYDEARSISALEIAMKYGIDVKDLHQAYAAYRASL